MHDPEPIRLEVTLPVPKPQAPRPSYAASTQPTTRPGPPVWSKHTQWVTLNGDISGGEQMWADEFRYHLTEAPIVLVCHGDTVTHKGQWWLIPDVGPSIRADGEDGAIARLQRKYPGQPVVLISCNEAGMELRMPGVWYARQKVWSRPTTKPEHAKRWSDFEVGR